MLEARKAGRSIWWWGEKTSPFKKEPALSEVEWGD